MTDYEKTFIAEETVTTLNKYIEKLKEVRQAAEDAANREEEGDKDNAGEGGTGEVEGAGQA